MHLVEAVQHWLASAVRGARALLPSAALVRGYTASASPLLPSGREGTVKMFNRGVRAVGSARTWRGVLWPPIPSGLPFFCSVRVFHEHAQYTVFFTKLTARLQAERTIGSPLCSFRATSR